jgi:hypothetical protein
MTTIEFGYTVGGREHTGVLSYSDGLLGPLVVSPDEETAFTFCAGYHQAGANAVFLRQEIDAPVVYREVGRDESPESVLSRFIGDWLPGLGDLREQVRLLMADYLGHRA